VGRRFRRWLRPWFTLRDPVDRWTYLRHGLALMIFKYVVDAAVIGLVLGRFWTPLDYLGLPSITLRARTLGADPDWLLLGLALWTLPFVWIGVAMTLRRAVDAGQSAWLCLLFFVPIGNYVLMLVLSRLPTREPAAWRRHDPAPQREAQLRSAFAGVAAGAGAALLVLLVSVFLARRYGEGLFFGAPLILGMMTAFVFNRRHPRTSLATLQVVLVGLVVTGGVFVLFALEGILCVAMTLPLAAPLAVLGAVAGRAIAVRTPTPASHAWLLVLVLPGVAAVETSPASSPLHEVVSVVEVDAPPEGVWTHVVSFSELTAPPAWLFRLGVAYPRRARIEGTDVGAVRYCEFSTGPFVEPITRWEEPSRLAFDVASQPPPMAEWSPYRRVQAPHLDGYFRTRRGEFRLVRLPGDRTRLEGSTWYELEMAPQIYWKMLADVIISRIHLRVLDHVKALSEQR
jgi:uncharacterized membrane protein YhaH (DUF805 family)